MDALVVNLDARLAGAPGRRVMQCARIAGRDFDRMPRCLFEQA